MTILLPPSEGKAPGGSRAGWDVRAGRFGAELRDDRAAVVAALTESGGGNERLLHARGDLLARSLDANRSVLGAPTLPAWRRYTGVVWDHLDLPSTATSTKQRARGSVLVLNALCGVTGLHDPLPDHRLTFGISLPPLGRLDRWWRPRITRTLATPLRRRLVIDLLPAEHRKAWDPDPTTMDLVRVTFTRDGSAAVGHGAKAAKGLLARALLESADPMSTLRGFTHDGLRVVAEEW